MIEVEVDLSKFIPEFSEALAKQIGLVDEIKRNLTTSIHAGVVDMAPYWSGKTKSSWFITPGMTPRSFRTTTQQGVYWPEPTPDPDSLPEAPFDWDYTVHTTNEYAEAVNAGAFKDEHAMFVERGVDLGVFSTKGNYNSIVIEVQRKPAKPSILSKVTSWFKGLFKR